MRIGIDARMYGPAHSGIGRYIEQLITQLKDMDTENEYVIFLRSDAYDVFVLPNEKWKKVLADVTWYTLEEQLRMPKTIAREQVDLMHFPHWNVPVLYRGPYVVTIHDLIMFHFSRKEATTLGPILYAFKDRVHRILVRLVARRARHILTTSEFTKQDIVTTLGVTNDKITVTYQAPYSHNEQQTTNKEHILQTWNVKKPYVLYVGNAYPHKNLLRLIQAWKQIEQHHADIQLVLAGKESVFYEKIKAYAIMQHCNNIIWTGFVTDDELSSLYTYAHLYVFPSLYEGFGLPPLEAIRHGVPVVSSSASCLPEVLGEGALYVDPESVDDMARGIEEGITNTDLRHQLKLRGEEELRRYSWHRLAVETRAVYQHTVA